MKIIASADHHYDEHCRLAECQRIHAWIADLVRVEKPDLFVSGGDVYERASTPVEREAAADWLAAVADVCPVVIAKGNHDRPRDAAFMRRIKSRHPIIVEEAAAVHHVGGAAIAVVAWPDRAALAAATGTRGEAADQAARAALAGVLQGLGDELSRHAGARILLGHFMIDGSRTSTGQELLGAELNVGLSDLALARAEVVIAGHIHAGQHWYLTTEGAPVPVAYPGSPYRRTFGELEKKHVLLLEWWEHKPPVLCGIETPATPMFHVDDEWSGDAGDGQPGWLAGAHGLPDEVSGAELRFRYRVASDQRDAARAAAARWRDQWLAEGAISVKVEEQLLTTTRARAPEIAQASTLSDKLRALWRSRGDEPPPERAAELLRKAGTLEASP